ncbi:hypothetical protein BaRGS_00016504 [Batillaria attramentaria]|uniref:Uncharacterized protein n=1 Tax=Batillaria attramentaria TaxID=370345 RepID=A0ABD0KZL9_9CAEN
MSIFRLYGFRTSAHAYCFKTPTGNSAETRWNRKRESERLAVSVVHVTESVHRHRFVDHFHDEDKAGWFSHCDLFQ